MQMHLHPAHYVACAIGLLMWAAIGWGLMAALDWELRQAERVQVVQR